MRRLSSILTAAAVGFLLGWWARGFRLNYAGDSIETRIDTVYYERPQCVASNVRPRTVNVPRVLFAPSVVAENATTVSCSENPNTSGNVSEYPTCSSDSVQMQIEIETRVYEDSLYRAQVSGPAVGCYHPTLDWIETYSRTQTITRTQRHRFAVTAGVGAAYTPRGIQPTVGVQVGVVLWGF